MSDSDMLLACDRKWRHRRRLCGS